METTPESHQRRIILLIRPAEQERDALVAALRDHGFDVVETMDDEEALARVGVPPPIDVIVREQTDDAAEFLRRARQRRQGVRVVVLAEGPQNHVAFRDPATAVLGGPVDPHQLAYTAANLLPRA
jgi:CheY-like chemotaxis protein